MRGCWSHAACSAAKHKQATSVGLRQAHVAFLLGPGTMSDLNPKCAVILVIANIGIERISPGIPHIQNQKTSEMMTRTGLRVNRLARSIGVKVSLCFYFGHAPTGRGTIFIFAANFHPIEGGARSAGQRVSYLFARLNLPCPAIGLSYPDMSLC